MNTFAISMWFQGLLTGLSLGMSICVIARAKSERLQAKRAQVVVGDHEVSSSSMNRLFTCCDCGWIRNMQNKSKCKKTGEQCRARETV